MWKGDQQGDLEFKASVNNMACSCGFPCGFREAFWEGSSALVSCPPLGKSFSYLAVSDGFMYHLLDSFTQTPFGMEGSVFNFKPLDLSDGSYFYVSNGNSCYECCCADERSKNANECSDALRLLHLHCWPFLQLFFKHTLFFWESRVRV